MKAYIQIQDSERRAWEEIPAVTRSFKDQREALEKIDNMANMCGREVRVSFPLKDTDKPGDLNGIYL